MHQEHRPRREKPADDQVEPKWLSGFNLPQPVDASPSDAEPRAISLTHTTESTDRVPE